MPGSSVALPARASSATETGLCADHPRRLAVGEHPVAHRPVELVQGAQLVQRGGDLGITHRPSP